MIQTVHAEKSYLQGMNGLFFLQKTEYFFFSDAQNTCFLIIRELYSHKSVPLDSFCFHLKENTA